MSSVYVDGRTASLIERSSAILEAKELGEQSPFAHKTRSVPTWLPSGEEVVSLKQASVLMGMPDDLAARYVLESKSVSEELAVDAMSHLQVKAIRKVRTPAGRKRFGQEIGSIIVRDGLKLGNLKLVDDMYDGTTSAKATDGKVYHVTKDSDSGKWVAMSDNGMWDNMVVEDANTEEEAFELLNGAIGTTATRKNGASVKGGQKKPAAATSTAKKPDASAKKSKLSKNEQADYDALPNDKARREYDEMIEEGYNHNSAIDDLWWDSLTSSQDNAVRGMDTLVRDWYWESRHAGDSHSDALKAVKEYDKITGDDDFSRADHKKLKDLVKKHGGSYQKALEEWKGSKQPTKKPAAGNVVDKFKVGDKYTLGGKQYTYLGDMSFRMDDGFRTKKGTYSADFMERLLKDGEKGGGDPGRRTGRSGSGGGSPKAGSGNARVVSAADIKPVDLPNLNLMEEFVPAKDGSKYDNIGVWPHEDGSFGVYVDDEEDKPLKTFKTREAAIAFAEKEVEPVKVPGKKPADSAAGHGFSSGHNEDLDKLMNALPQNEWDDYVGLPDDKKFSYEMSRYVDNQSHTVAMGKATGKIRYILNRTDVHKAPAKTHGFFLKPDGSGRELDKETALRISDNAGGLYSIDKRWLESTKNPLDMRGAAADGSWTPNDKPLEFSKVRPGLYHSADGNYEIEQTPNGWETYESDNGVRGEWMQTHRTLAEAQQAVRRVVKEK